jgi:signal transduction histidine kinase
VAVRTPSRPPTRDAPVETPASDTASTERPPSRSSARVVAQLAVVGLFVVYIELAMAYASAPPAPWWALLLWPAAACAYLGAGCIAWVRRPSNRMGAIMVAGALVCLLAGLDTDIPVLVATFLVTATLPFAIIVHLLHAFPSGRLRGRLSVATVAAGYVVWVVLEVPDYLYGQGPESPRTVLQIADRPDLAHVGQWMQWGAGACVMAVTAVLLFRRARAAPVAQRRVLAPLYLYGIFTVVFVTVSSRVALFILDDMASIYLWLGVVQVTVITGVPIAFLIALLRGGFARTGEIEELGAWLVGHGAARPPLRDALADSLGDPSLELVVWVPGRGTYVDGHGRPIVLGPASGARPTVEVDLRGRRVGAVVYDATLIADASVVRAAGRVIAMALDHERLTADLRASRDELRASRARIVEATDGERRRLARDLHDGLQSRLVLLAIQAHAVRTNGGSDGTLALEQGLQAAITELRELVQGVMPAALTERGLCAAIEDLVDRVPIPTELVLPAAWTRFPDPTESAGYFVVSEAISNALKHAHTRVLSIRVEELADTLRVEIRDDGVGGATVGSGAGLRSMADRVDAADGHFRLESPAGAGTRVVAELPCR